MCAMMWSPRCSRWPGSWRPSRGCGGAARAWPQTRPPPFALHTPDATIQSMSVRASHAASGKAGWHVDYKRTRGMCTDGRSIMCISAYPTCSRPCAQRRPRHQQPRNQPGRPFITCIPPTYHCRHNLGTHDVNEWEEGFITRF